MVLEQHFSARIPARKMGDFNNRYQPSNPPNYSATSSDDETATAQSSEVPEKSTSNEYALGVAFWSFVLFTATQTVFAIIANSQAMMTDSQAMFVDALTYLFNLIAERLKRRSYSQEEMESVHPKVLAYRRERLRLYLELFPPLISATILMVVTFSATEAALMTLSGPQYNVSVNINLMLIFSFANLLLDFLNVGVFANAHQAYGIGEVEKEEILYTTSRDEEISEHTALNRYNGVPQDGVYDLCDIDEEVSDSQTKPLLTLNLNMCSAYTHVMADTMRSVAVLIAAFIAFCFDSVDGSVADSLATLVVSVIILFSLLPLLHGLLSTMRRIIDLRADFPVLDV